MGNSQKSQQVFTEFVDEIQANKDEIVMLLASIPKNGQDFNEFLAKLISVNDKAKYLTDNCCNQASLIPLVMKIGELYNKARVKSGSKPVKINMKSTTSSDSLQLFTKALGTIGLGNLGNLASLSGFSLPFKTPDNED